MHSQPADLVAVAIPKQTVELAAVALEFGAFVEHLAKGLLHDLDVLTDPQLATKLALDIGRSGQVIGMDMGLDQPFELELVLLNIGDYRVGAVIGNAACRIVDIHHGIDDCTGHGIGIFDDIADGICRGIEEGGDLRLDRQVSGEWYCGHGHCST